MEAPNQPLATGSWQVERASFFGQKRLTFKDQTNNLEFRINCFVQQRGLFSPSLKSLQDKTQFVQLTVKNTANQDVTIYVKIDTLATRLDIEKAAITNSPNILETIKDPVIKIAREDQKLRQAKRINKVAGTQLQQAIMLVEDAHTKNRGEILLEGAFVIGKDKEGRVIVGKKQDLIGKGGETMVYSFKNYASSVEKTKLVFKEPLGAIVRDYSSLRKDYEVMKKAHGTKPSSYIVDALIPISDSQGKMVAGLQTREGESLSHLVIEGGAPSITTVWEGIKGARKNWEDKGLINFDSKLENFVVSHPRTESHWQKRLITNLTNAVFGGSAGASVKAIDGGGVYSIEENYSTNERAFTPDYTPLEGRNWMWLLTGAIKNPEKLKNLNIIDLVKKRRGKGTEELGKEEVIELLKEELMEVSTKLTHYHDSLAAYKYVSGSFKPFSLEKLEGRNYQKVTGKFHKPWGWRRVPEKIREEILEGFNQNFFIKLSEDINSLYW